MDIEDMVAEVDEEEEEVETGEVAVVVEEDPLVSGNNYTIVIVNYNHFLFHRNDDRYERRDRPY